MVFSTSVTSSPNGSSEVAAGGAAAGGAWAAAGEKTAKLTTAAATADNHQTGEGIIRFLPGVAPSAKPAKHAPATARYAMQTTRCRLHDADYTMQTTRCSARLAIYSS